MAEYIERGALIERLGKNLVACNPGTFSELCFADAIETVKHFPAADVAPVVHGRWIRPHWKNSNYCYDCSECGGEAMHRDYQWAKDGIYPICPNCGAIMDGDTERRKT